MAAHFDMGDLPVAHVQNPVGDCGRFRVMRNHQNGLFHLATGGAEHVEHGVRIFRIEIAGWFVCENDGRSRDQGSCDCNSLLFAARELVGAMIEAAVDAEQLGEVVEERAVERDFATGDLVRNLDIAHCGEGGKEVKALKNKAYAGFAKLGAGAVRQWREIDAVDGDRAGGGLGEAAEDVKEGGFAGAGGANDGNELTSLDLEADVAKSRNLNLSSAIRLAQRIGGDDGVHWLKCEFSSLDGMMEGWLSG